MTTLAGRIRLSLGQLRWKLTASYTAVTVGALLVAIIILLVGGAVYWQATSVATPGLLLHHLEAGYVPILRPYLAERPPDIETLRTFLARFQTNLVQTQPLRAGNLQLSISVAEVATVVFFGADGQPIDSLPHGSANNGLTGVTSSGGDLVELTGPVRAALAGSREQDRLIHKSASGAWAGAFPIFASEDSVRIVGAVGFVTRPVLWSFQYLARQLGLLILFVLLLAGVMGMLFGSLTARGLLQRVERIRCATSGWSQGDFATSVHDRAGDELASLAGDLDHMARQLAQLIDRRQQMSIVEERRRLARDLHDSAKQQAFAASAQLGAARALFALDRDRALAHAGEAEGLMDQVRCELTTLIQELRPVALEKGGLSAGLGEFARDWADLSACELELSIDDTLIIPDAVQEAVFRIAQEALANVARHSCATRVILSLKTGPEGLCLTIQDDGCGFDTEQPRSGVGLASMRERAELVGGRLSVSSVSRVGTRIQITVPT